MVLSGQTIRSRGIFSPFFERTKAFGMTFGLGPAGYDVRIAENVVLYPLCSTLASTVEYFSMPNDIIGNVADKSTWARKFIAVQNTIIEPGWRGHLTLEISNHGKDILRIEKGMPIAQIIFHLLDKPTDTPYNGKYQDQPKGPVCAIMEDI